MKTTPIFFLLILAFSSCSKDQKDKQKLKGVWKSENYDDNLVSVDTVTFTDKYYIKNNRYMPYSVIDKKLILKIGGGENISKLEFVTDNNVKITPEISVGIYPLYSNLTKL